MIDSIRFELDLYTKLYIFTLELNEKPNIIHRSELI